MPTNRAIVLFSDRKLFCSRICNVFVLTFSHPIVLRFALGTAFVLLFDLPASCSRIGHSFVLGSASVLSQDYEFFVLGSASVLFQDLKLFCSRIC